MVGEDEIEGRNRDDEQMHYNSTNLSLPMILQTPRWPWLPQPPPNSTIKRGGMFLAPPTATSSLSPYNNRPVQGQPQEGFVNGFKSTSGEGSKDIPLPTVKGGSAFSGSQPKNDARQGGSAFSGNNLLGESEYSEGGAGGGQDETFDDGFDSKKRRRSDQVFPSPPSDNFSFWIANKIQVNLVDARGLKGSDFLTIIWHFDFHAGCGELLAPSTDNAITPKTLHETAAFPRKP
ncbi:hypothetical protein L1887_17119 [Cichorium endivia]|nr:hypothetical protein L1887_17119 [Cichorium endivia]